ncbi:MAG: GNAT family N-acetyltransferase [Thalassobaculum sp.]|uniref:GNAT family N-acetyltransferase n=1 Tax=Thalassobaculum sp. TaxID=2022740 RepID=UPI0032EE04FB
MNAAGVRVVRLDGPARLPQVLAAIHGAFAEYEGKLAPPSAAMKETVDSLARRLAAGALFVAEDADGTVIGAVCAERKGEAIYLDRLAVPPAARGRGVAAALVAAVEAFAAETGAASVTLGVRLALADNIGMFERLGYVETARTAHPGFDRPTSASMAKPVGRGPGGRGPGGR